MMHKEKKDAVDCRGAMEKLFDLLDGELTPDKEQQIRSHMSGCPHCFGQADFEQRFLDALHASRASDVSGSAGSASGALRERVREALRAEGWRGDA